MVFMAALFIGAGYLLGGQGGMLVALLISLVFNFGAYWFSEKIALNFARAKPLAPGQLTWLAEANTQLSQRAGIPAPSIYISPDPQPNAFACGRGPGAAAVCFNVGLIEGMSQREVIGVLAHELAHIKNRDTLTMTVVASIASAIMWLTYIAMFFGNDRNNSNVFALLVVWLLGPIAASLVQMAVSRTREYAADKTAAQLMGDGNPLADALESLARTTQMIRSETAAPATAHMYIANPLRAEGLAGLFSTHPPIEDRVRRLRAMRSAS